jgi:hypothetical protein
MYRMVIFLAIVGTPWSCALLASEERPIHAPGPNERLKQAVGSEGGVTVYKDHEGNVESVLDPPGGERRVTVQPPPSESMNLGPPLQLHNPLFHVPQTGAPGTPPVPEFPQKAR